MATRRVDESMALLNDMMRQPVDPSYASAAARRVARGLPRSTSTRTILVFVTLALIGLLFALSALNVRAATSVAGQARAELIGSIESRQSEGDELASQATRLAREVAALQADALGDPGQRGVLDQVAALSVATGAVAVKGPGLQLTLDDAEAASGENANPRGQSGFGSGRVSATDVQLVTNGLWQAGAEAIAINGQRLSATSAIRFAGEAILVDFRPLARPYVISAIGDPAGMQSRFVASATGSYFKALADNYKIRTELVTEDSLTLSGHPSAALRYAQTVPTGIPSTASPSATPTETSRAPSPTNRATETKR
ncbi:MAG: DUF881 domain-containing protein [Dermatophilaceae bacterium]